MNPKSHDYRPEWDYSLDKKSSLRELTSLVCDQLRRDLLPFLGTGGPFSDFDVRLVKNLRCLGKYVSGTNSLPVIVVDARAVQRGADEYGVPLDTAIRTTILHELGHALQEASGLPLDEGQAERFAFVFEKTGRVFFFWKS